MTMAKSVVESNISQQTTDEVLSHLFTAVVDEMAWILVRSAYTTFVKESQDFATALVSTGGEIAAYPKNAGVASLVATPMGPGIHAFDDWAPGDVMITNDPYSTAGMVTQLNDIYMLKPIFDGDEIVCFGFAFIHCTDVGGAVPGSIDMRHHEIFQEGIRIRPARLYKRGVFNEELWSILADNSRIPTLNRGDISALVASVDKAEARVTGLVAKYGAANVKRAINRTIDHTDAIARRVLSEIPAGEYRFIEYFEDDYISDIPIRLEVCLISRGDGSVTLDFTGSDPQVKSALNMPTGGQKHHPFLSRTFINYIITKEPTITLNGGLLRSVDLVLPKESIVNCAFPAAVGMRATTSIRLHDAVLGALIQAVPNTVPAGGASQVAVTGARVVTANPIQGGSGGSAVSDGLSGSDRPLAYLRSVPVEILESEGPVVVHRFGLVPDSEGAGKFRGGFGVEFQLEVTHPEAILVMRGKDRHRFSAWGALGGSAGTVGTNLSVLPGQDPRYIGKDTVYHPQLGETVVLRGGGGGGFGNPFERETKAVLGDVLAGLVSPGRARDVYGVVIANDAVDFDATAALRKEKARTQPPATAFDFGPGRTRWEADYDAAAGPIRKWIWSLPFGLRWYGRQQVWSRLKALGKPPFGPKHAAQAIVEVEEFLRSRRLLATASTAKDK
jgi:N-methylhydantoinase B